MLPNGNDVEPPGPRAGRPRIQRPGQGRSPPEPRALIFCSIFCKLISITLTNVAAEILYDAPQYDGMPSIRARICKPCQEV